MTGLTKLGLILGIPVGALLLVPLLAPVKSKLGGARPRRKRRAYYFDAQIPGRPKATWGPFSSWAKAEEAKRRLRTERSAPRGWENETPATGPTRVEFEGVKVHGKKGRPGFSVSIEDEEISCWTRRWPDDSLDGLERVTAEFDTNGDLVDLECNEAGGSCEEWDGSALVALTEDMQCAGESRMGIKDRCHSDEWLHCLRD